MSEYGKYSRNPKSEHSKLANIQNLDTLESPLGYFFLSFSYNVICYMLYVIPEIGPF